jgi:hypothetical protein
MSRVQLLPKKFIHVAQKNFLTGPIMEKSANSPVLGKHGGIGEAVSQKIRDKNTNEAEFNCDKTTYFLWPQSLNFGWKDNASNFGSQYHVVGKFLGRILLRSQGVKMWVDKTSRQPLMSI